MARASDDNFVRWLIVNSFTWHKSTRFGGGLLMYDYLIKTGIIQRDDHQIKNNYRLAIQLNQLKLNSLNISKKEYKNFPSVINDTKALCVDDFFNELRSNEQNVCDYINGKILNPIS